MLVEDDTIVAVGDRREIEQQAAPHFPTTSTLLPGLINAHVHLCFDAAPHFLENLTRAARPRHGVDDLRNLRLVRSRGREFQPPG
ncbi:hypothetical protein [Saccharopolyspora elongata]|uniref:Uncharacterized protein n=1 Tax=Saccharopolyspora elongata TaxID=2530387 RepID=A0A4R4Z1C8_9PSEU|nr:hypothetical protein [Saccharopolyspora elongata]TDD51643.1 hypothetical protein E1288_13785 [Saccharopolyspora elongata]